ncbi:MAG: hypothetical protein SGJ00_11910 [bacterium]|nr:hypothetical protein [bacterium]
MKSTLPFVGLLFFFLTSDAQVKKYATSSGELIFSFADYKMKGEQVNTPVRFTCFFHYSGNKHVDFSDKFGLYTGAAIRNVGFTSTNGDTMIKRRNYYIGIPLAIKIGNLKKDKYLFAGVEGDFAINYKEKLFINEIKKDKFNIWFCNRTNAFLPSAFVGVNFKSGLNLKFKYYLKDFYNKNFVASGVKIYENTQSQVFYFSLSMNIRNQQIYKTTYNKGL